MRRTSRSGFSLVELLVVVGIVSVLLALTVAGVSYSRQVAHRLQCQNQLKQLALATIQYADSHRSYPGAWRHFQYVVESISPGNAVTDGKYHDLLLCPAEAHRVRTTMNYRVNMGGVVDDGWVVDGMLPQLEFLNSNLNPATTSRIRDGLSQTALHCERMEGGLLGVGQTSRETRRYFLKLPAGVGESPLVGACDACEAAPNGNVAVGPQETFHVNTQEDLNATYYHRLTPNRAQCECPQSLDGVNRGCQNYAWVLRPVSSWHSGGVNLSFADGHVQFIADGIDRNVWIAMGTAAGSDAALP